jgi:hypothetical protein
LTISFTACKGRPRIEARSPCVHGDLNLDSTVTFADFSKLVGIYGKSEFWDGGGKFRSLVPEIRAVGTSGSVVHPGKVHKARQKRT